MTGDLFDAALHLESQHIAEGYNDGLRCAAERNSATPPLRPSPPPPLTAASSRRCRRDGRRSGHAEGRALGLQKGFELGHEVGFYSGCCQLWRQLQAADPQLFGCANRRAAACWPLPARCAAGCTGHCLLCLVRSLCACADVRLIRRPNALIPLQAAGWQGHYLVGRHGPPVPTRQPTGEQTSWFLLLRFVACMYAAASAAGTAVAPAAAAQASGLAPLIACGSPELWRWASFPPPGYLTVAHACHPLVYFSAG